MLGVARDYEKNGGARELMLKSLSAGVSLSV